ncbi:Vinx1 [Hyposoter didymator ichnovirus]|nr:viral innexin [Hyposoter didymator ichnovirus]AIK25631.1 Vinx1 [Hyposoter didymator ichnovirus]
MPDVFGAIFGRCSRQSVVTDSAFFRLNYRITVILLVASAWLLFVLEIFLDPMECTFADYPKGDFNSYCSLKSIFTLRRKVTLKEHVSHVEGSAVPAYVGVRVFTYYQLCSITLLLQAVLFYIPRCVWKWLEGGKMKMLATELITPIKGGDCERKDIQPLTSYFRENLHKHDRYAFGYMICELLNVFNLGVQLQLLNHFTGKSFEFSDVYAIFTAQPTGVTDMTGQTLSMTTECTYPGPFNDTGNPGDITGICELVPNSYNDQIQVFLWLWMYLLNAFGVLVILYRFATCVISLLRWLKFRVSVWIIPDGSQAVVFERLKIGDWFVLTMLRQNIREVLYVELITQLAVIYMFHDQDESLKFITE